MVKHNNVIPNRHFKKKWQFHVKTWFNQPARKTRRHQGELQGPVGAATLGRSHYDQYLTLIAGTLQLALPRLQRTSPGPQQVFSGQWSMARQSDTT